MSKQQRNDTCSCGSGTKYKLCCRPTRIQAKEAVELEYLRRDNRMLRDILKATDERLVALGEPSIQEWIDEQIEKEHLDNSSGSGTS